ncbi:hypothetical protein NDU88_004255 [Pleurodeles waltl]|uniref:Uncharacterized protein n=1 Tax=Pleurodeles waltl TaxID=8319 RepID=A0AAV7M5U9_PLEWA|nr:hypothetical protein NDU88_004255 [Pleurodeles waltl]
MLTKPTTSKAEAVTMEWHERDKEGVSPITQSFLEGLFTSLNEDLQEVKRDLLRDLKAVRHDLEEVGERVATLEEHENSQDEEIVHLQQEVIRLKEKQIELQAHTKYLENRLWRNNIRTHRAPTLTRRATLLTMSDPFCIRY